MTLSLPPDTAASAGAAYTPASDAVVAPQVACANCGAELAGHFCQRCGAPRADERPLTVRRFAGELVAEFTSVDSVTLQTVTALVRQPGRLTAEYLAGRTRRFVPPLRLYLAFWALMIFSVSLYTRGGGMVDTQRVSRELTARQSRDTTMAKVFARSAQRHGMSEADMQAQLVGVWQQYASNPWVRLVDPLLVAGVLALLFRARRRNYAEHVVWALHLLAFNSALTMITSWLHFAARDSGTSINRGVSLLHWLSIGTYFFLAARLLFAESRPRTVAKSVAFVVGAQLAVMVVPIAAMLVAMVMVMMGSRLSALGSRLSATTGSGPGPGPVPGLARACPGPVSPCPPGCAGSPARRT